MIRRPWLTLAIPLSALVGCSGGSVECSRDADCPEPDRTLCVMGVCERAINDSALRDGAIASDARQDATAPAIDAPSDVMLRLDGHVDAASPRDSSADAMPQTTDALSDASPLHDAMPFQDAMPVMDAAVDRFTPRDVSQYWGRPTTMYIHEFVDASGRLARVDRVRAQPSGPSGHYWLETYDGSLGWTSTWNYRFAGRGVEEFADQFPDGRTFTSFPGDEIFWGGRLTPGEVVVTHWRGNDHIPPSPSAEAFGVHDVTLLWWAESVRLSDTVTLDDVIALKYRQYGCARRCKSESDAAWALQGIVYLARNRGIVRYDSYGTDLNQWSFAGTWFPSRLCEESDPARFRCR